MADRVTLEQYDRRREALLEAIGTAESRQDELEYMKGGYQIDEARVLRAFGNWSRYLADEMLELDEDGRREALLDVLDSVDLERGQ